MHRSRSSSSGFSLIEAVVAMALLALALPSIYALMFGAITRATRASDRAAALLRAESVLVQAKSEFHGQFGVREEDDPDGRSTVETMPFPVLKQKASTSTQKDASLPVRLIVSVQARSGPPVVLDTLFLFREERR